MEHEEKVLFHVSNDLKSKLREELREKEKEEQILVACSNCKKIFDIIERQDNLCVPCWRKRAFLKFNVDGPLSVSTGPSRPYKPLDPVKETTKYMKNSRRL